MNLNAVFESMVNAGIPVSGVSSDGRIDFRPEATEAQRTLARSIYDNWVEPTTVEQAQAALVAQISDSRLARLLLEGEDINGYTTDEVIAVLLLLVQYALQNEKFSWTQEARR